MREPHLAHLLALLRPEKDVKDRLEAGRLDRELLALRVGVNAESLGDTLDWARVQEGSEPRARGSQASSQRRDALATSSPSTSSDLTLPSATDVLRKSSIFQTSAFLFWSDILKKVREAVVVKRSGRVVALASFWARVNRNPSHLSLDKLAGALVGRASSQTTTSPSSLSSSPSPYL